jgi:hypothetical protein
MLVPNTIIHHLLTQLLPMECSPVGIAKVYAWVMTSQAMADVKHHITSKESSLKGYLMDMEMSIAKPSALQRSKLWMTLSILQQLQLVRPLILTPLK